jgi:multidrug efflux pump subunit AcrA (membrane-fusion protein)
LIDMRTHFKIFCLAVLVLVSCKNGAQKSDTTTAEGRVPVTVTNISVQDLKETTDLNATSVFLLKTYVKSSTNGYLKDVNIQLGDYIAAGKIIFIIRSKEAQNIGNTVVSLDSTLHFSGLVSLKSPGNGYVTQLTYRSGDYVQEGETLASISDANSLVFMLELPYELRQYLNENKVVSLTLPDGQVLNGNITSLLPEVDPASQTQRCIIKVPHIGSIPENLIAKVHFVKRIKSNAVTLPKEAVLTNEIQSRFWIMKMTDSCTAVKIPVIKGIEASDRIEILSPAISQSDKILLTGNYGLPDTAKVVVAD